MTFLHVSLLAGTALVAVPIILHLVMRRRPTLLEFPALRFIQKRADANRRRLQLRHLLLLLLRAGLIALLAFALARPSVKLAGAIGSQEAPVAAALVFDAAPRMEYRHDNLTRLEAGRDMGLWLLAQLPELSEVALSDTRLGATAAFQADRGAARERITRLETVSNSQSLPAAIDGAVKLLRQSQLDRKELYIFSDLSRSAWPEEQAARLQQLLGEAGDLGIYVIDVGMPNPTDYGLGEVRLSGEVLSNRSRLTVETELSCMGAAAPRVVELHLLDADRKPQNAGVQEVEAAPGELRPMEFRVAGLEPGTHQGFVRIVGQDGLAADDTRYFTVAVRPAWRVLVAAPKTPQSDAVYLSQALAPAESRKRGDTRFDCDVCDLGELAKRPLGEYAAVCLLDPTPLEPATWKKLADFAAEGRGVAIFLGRNAQPIDSFNAPQAQELLAGNLLRQVPRPDGELRLAPRDYQHPILAAFRDRAGAVPWDAFPILRYWELDLPEQGTVPIARRELSPFSAAGASVVLPYSDGRPALLEKVVGQGRVLTMTTPVSDRPSERPWNLLPALDSWPFMILVNQIAAHLVGSNDEQLNYFAGQTAMLPIEESGQRRDYLLFTPGGLSFPVSADLKRRELAITATDQVGNYRLQAGGSAGVDLGFSVNYAPQQTQLDRLSGQELTNVFGPVKFRLARTRDEIDRDISMGRVGRELFSPLILIVALALGLEMLVANRFYGE
jgi:hypothetical protein